MQSHFACNYRHAKEILSVVSRIRVEAVITLKILPLKPEYSNAVSRCITVFLLLSRKVTGKGVVDLESLQHRIFNIACFSLMLDRLTWKNNMACFIEKADITLRIYAFALMVNLNEM